MNVLNQPEKRVRMNEAVTNTDNLKADCLKVVQSLTIDLWMRLDKFQDPKQMRPKTDIGIDSSVRSVYKLAKSAIEISSQFYESKIYNKTIEDLIQMRSRTNLNTGSSIRSAYKLTKSAIEISNKVHKSKTYNEAIDNLIYGNRWRKAIEKKL